MRPYLLRLILTILLLSAPLFAFGQSTSNKNTAQVLPKPKTAQIDPGAMALLCRVDARMRGLKTYSADFTIVSPPNRMHGEDQGGYTTGSVRLMQPNYACAEGWEEIAPSGAVRKAILGQIFASDGKNYYHWVHDGELTKKTANPSGANVHVGFLLPVNSFFSPGNSLVRNETEDERDDQSYIMRLGQPVRLDGVTCQVVEIADVSTYQNTLFHDSEEFCISPDLLVRRFRIVLNGDRGETKMTVDLSHIALNAPMTAESFVFKQPATVKIPVSAMPPPPPPLLAKGAIAPDFKVQDHLGRLIQLSDYKGKTVVLDFWATWCDPCQKSLPDINQVARAFKARNVVVLAVDAWNTADAFQYWLPRHKSYDALVFAIDTRDYARYVTSLYHVDSLPTQYVINKDGKIVASFVGYDKPNDDLAKAIKAAGAS